MRAAHTILLSVALCGGAGALGVTDAVAEVCHAGCKGELKGCLESARAAKIDCRLACRSDADPADVGTCLQGCREAFRSGRRTCRGGTSTCVAACREAPVSTASAACLGECGVALGQCARDVTSDRPGCFAGCPNGPDRHACVEECLAPTSDGIEDCLAEAADCRAACGSETSTSTTSSTATSTTGITTTTSTTLPIACVDSDAPTCGGACPEGQVCVDIGPAGCNCLAGSPSSAFLD